MADSVVIIPFRRWNPLLETCVAACVDLDASDFVVCLVPDSPTSIPPLWSAHPRVEVIAAGPGISQKRNAAIRAHPEAAFYACVDSDAWPEREWLSRAHQAFAEDPDVWLVGGPNLAPADLPFAREAVAQALLSPLVSGPKVFTRRATPAREARDLPACNLIIRRAAIVAVGGFDEGMEVGEDSVPCQAVLDHGRRIAFRPEVRVWHLPRSLYRPFLRQRIVSGYGIPPLLRRCRQSMGAAAVLTELLPALALAFLFGGAVAAVAWPPFAPLWLGVWVFYGLLIAGETLRVTSHPRFWVATAVAIAIGNLAPGIGILYQLAGRRLRLGEYYRNDAPGRPN